MVEHQSLDEKAADHTDHSTENDDSVDGNHSPVESEPPAATSPSSPPNGGLLAWVQVAGSFCIFLNTWGIVNAFGVFQAYYSHSLIESSSASAISWIGGVQTFLLNLVGTLVGPIYDAGHVRLLLVTGYVLSLLGMFMTSICKTYWQLFLAQGLVTGAGLGCLFLPGVAIVSQYFSTKKAFATGIASLGTSIGGVVYSILWDRLENKLGFGWATRIIAFIMMATLIFPLFALHPLQYPQKRRSLGDLFDRNSLRDLPYVLFGFGILFGYMGIYVVFFYIQLYAQARTDISAHLAYYLIAIINAGSAFGRILPNFAADYVGTLNMQASFAAVAAVLGLCLIAIRSVKGILAFCVLYGFFTGTFVSLPAPTVASLSKNVESLGARMSMAFMAAGIGSLIGSPIAGAVLATNGGDNWDMVQVWSGVLLVLSSSTLFAARVAKVGLKFNAKA